MLIRRVARLVAPIAVGVALGVGLYAPLGLWVIPVLLAAAAAHAFYTWCWLRRAERKMKADWEMWTTMNRRPR